MWSAKRVVVGCAYALATVCASQVADAVSHDILGEGDVVRISVFQNPDLTTEARISERGSINFPLIGEVVIGGLPAPGAQTRLAQQPFRGKIVGDRKSGVWGKKGDLGGRRIIKKKKKEKA